MMTRQWRALTALILALACAGAAWAEEDQSVDVSAGVAYVSRYVWRGLPLNNDPAVQPTIALAKDGFSLNFWGSVDATDWGRENGGYGDRTGKLTEVDYTATYERALGKVNLAVGFLNYTYPNTNYNSTTEIYAALGLEVPLAPTLSYYVDEDVAGGAAYYALDFSHSFSLWESGERSIGLDLAAHAGYANEKFVNPYYGLDLRHGGAWHDWSAVVAFPLSLGAGFSITPAYNFSALWDERIREAVDRTQALSPDNHVFVLTASWDGSI
jgi:uncharacterized protein (TIGR02001 family)